jgi:ABC-type multidrug transport system ATPase subunit
VTGTDTPASARPFAIELSGVSKHFGAMAALREVSATFDAGRFYAIVGDNGAGKSTLLRVIAGLMRPTRGAVRVLGGAPRTSAPRVGYMPHASMLYDDLTARENLRYFASLYGIPDATDLDGAITLVGLDPTLTRRVGQYSQGMRQRLSLARAAVHNPALLLLDEPFSNVDIASARHMVEVMALMRDAGKTIVVITHQPAIVESVADEFVVLSAGRIIERRSSPPGTLTAETELTRVTR